jgi:choline dehydrogenase-like flavoprotein
LSEQISVKEDKFVTGIEVERFGQLLKLKAKKEVIVSAGTVGSPQILLLSGIGPEEHLQSQDIPVVHDLPGVGENLQDHLMTSLWVQSHGKAHVGVDPFDIVNPLRYFNFFKNGRGPLVSNGIEIGAFIHSGIGNDTWKRPDLQLHTLSATAFIDYSLKYKHVLNLNDRHLLGAYQDIQEG